MDLLALLLLSTALAPVHGSPAPNPTPIAVRHGRPLDRREPLDIGDPASEVNCHGCPYLDLSQSFYNCPNQHITATLSVGVASTSWSTVCRPSGQRSDTNAAAATPTVPAGGAPVASASNRRPNGPPPSPTLRPAAAAKVAGGGIEPAACTTTYIVQPPQSAGKTLTTYASYTTTTVPLDCAGCSLAISTGLVGYGPPGVFTTTTTLPVGAITTYKCQ
ncbi:55eb36d6-febb-4ccb-8d6b-352e7bc73d75 [Thermothielavioides terrestris]|uniref:55eb36d6-febb-4ccb-8d6b-352e7bc73d75 n=1 Tax=Thermothielavioides terrestris TaxID=2587410 RepID=A0A3S4C8E6_9PEZI|nr:55eb36d6-febb-4ccb-8d6b-352e7bc73d75 [Thermothielavioides terrestris]